MLLLREGVFGTCPVSSATAAPGGSNPLSSPTSKEKTPASVSEVTSAYDSTEVVVASLILGASRLVVELESTMSSEQEFPDGGVFMS